MTYRPVRWVDMSLKCSLLKRLDMPEKDELGVRLQITLPFDAEFLPGCILLFW